MIASWLWSEDTGMVSLPALFEAVKNKLPVGSIDLQTDKKTGKVQVWVKWTADPSVKKQWKYWKMADAPEAKGLNKGDVVPVGPDGKPDVSSKDWPTKQATPAPAPTQAPEPAPAPAPAPEPAPKPKAPAPKPKPDPAPATGMAALGMFDKKIAAQYSIGGQDLTADVDALLAKAGTNIPSVDHIANDGAFGKLLAKLHGADWKDKYKNAKSAPAAAIPAEDDIGTAVHSKLAQLDSDDIDDIDDDSPWDDELKAKYGPNWKSAYKVWKAHKHAKTAGPMAGPVGVVSAPPPAPAIPDEELAAKSAEKKTVEKLKLLGDLVAATEAFKAQGKALVGPNHDKEAVKFMAQHFGDDWIAKFSSAVKLGIGASPNPTITVPPAAPTSAPAPVTPASTGPETTSTGAKVSDLIDYLKGVGFASPETQKALKNSPVFTKYVLQKYGQGWLDHWSKASKPEPIVLNPMDVTVLSKSVLGTLASDHAAAAVAGHLAALFAAGGSVNAIADKLYPDEYSNLMKALTDLTNAGLVTLKSYPTEGTVVTPDQKGLDNGVNAFNAAFPISTVDSAAIQNTLLSAHPGTMDALLKYGGNLNAAAAANKEVWKAASVLKNAGLASQDGAFLHFIPSLVKAVAKKATAAAPKAAPKPSTSKSSASAAKSTTAGKYPDPHPMKLSTPGVEHVHVFPSQDELETSYAYGADSLGGNKPKKIFNTKDGLFLGKADPSKARAAASVVASQIQSLVFGAGDYIPVMRGKLGHWADHGSIQPLLQGSTQLSDDSIKSLNPEQIRKLQAERVIDWLIANHDSKAANFIKTSDGTIFGCDKDQAFKFIGDDELTVSYKPNPSEPIHNKLYAAYVDGDIDLNPNDVLPVIQRMEAVSDEHYYAITQPYLDTIEDPDEREAKAEAIIDRKRSLRKDFEKFFTSIRALRGETGPFRFPDSDAVAAATKGAKPANIQNVAKLSYGIFPGWGYTATALKGNGHSTSAVPTAVSTGATGSVAVPPTTPAAPTPTATPAPTKKKKKKKPTEVAMPSVAGVPSASVLKFSASGASLGGAGTKDLYTDAEGKTWIFKHATGKGGKGKNEPFRVAAQVAHSAVATVVKPGNSIPLGPISFNGVAGTIQLKLDASGDLKGTSPASLTPSQMEDVASEHMLDWLMSQHDTHGGNLLKLTDGHIISIDKEQGFKYFPSDKLSVDYHPNAAYGESEPFYNQFWRDWGAGKFDFDPQVLAPYLDKLAAMPAADFETAVRPYADAMFPDSALEHANFIKGALNRKNTMRFQFEQFIGDLYAKREKEEGNFTFAGGWVPKGGTSKKAAKKKEGPKTKTVTYTGTQLAGHAGIALKPYVKGGSTDASKVTLKIPSSTPVEKLSSFIDEHKLPTLGPIKTGSNYHMVSLDKSVLENFKVEKEEVIAPPPDYSGSSYSGKKFPPHSGTPTYWPEVGLLESAEHTFAELDNVETSKDHGPGGKQFSVGGAAVELQTMRVRRTQDGSDNYYFVHMKLRPDVWDNLPNGQYDTWQFKHGSYDADSDTMKMTGVSRSLSGMRKFESGKSEVFVATGNQSFTFRGSVYAKIRPKPGQSVKDAIAESLDAVKPGLSKDVLREPTAEEREEAMLRSIIWGDDPKTAQASHFAGLGLKDLRTIVSGLGYGQDDLDAIAKAKSISAHGTFAKPGRWKTLGVPKTGTEPALKFLMFGGSTPARIVNVCKFGLQSIHERLLQGQAGTGASDDADETTGGADSAMLRCVTAIGIKNGHTTHDEAGNVSGNYKLIFAPDETDRFDAYMYPSDSFGNLGGPGHGSGNWHKRQPLSKVIQSQNTSSGHSGSAEICFRRGVPAKKLLRITTSSETYRSQLLSAMEEAGVSHVHGVPISDFVVVDTSVASVYEKYVKPAGY